MRGKLRMPPLLTRAFWAERAKPIRLRLIDSRSEDIANRELRPAVFGTGSLGWGLHERMRVKVGDERVWVQVNVTITVCGSKELPRDETPPPALPAAG